MGITYLEGTVTGPKGDKETLKFLLDTGATYSLLPEVVWKKLGLTPKRSMDFAMADGTIIERNISECHIEFREGDGHTPVIMGKAGDDMALLGVVTLENLGLVFHPFSRELRSMKLRI